MPKFYRIAEGASFTVTEYEYSKSDPDEWPDKFKTRKEAKEAIMRRNKKARDDEVMAELD